MQLTSDKAAEPPPSSGLSDKIRDAIQAHARSSIGDALAQSASLYVRDRDLPKLITITEADVASGYAGICTKLSVALDRERSRRAAGHWSHSASRHMALMAALMAEMARAA